MPLSFVQPINVFAVFNNVTVFLILSLMSTTCLRSCMVQVLCGRALVVFSIVAVVSVMLQQCRPMSFNLSNKVHGCTGVCGRAPVVFSIVAVVSVMLQQCIPMSFDWSQKVYGCTGVCGCA